MGASTTMEEDAKRKAARAALDELNELPQRGVVGLGSGSTARLFVEELGARVRAGLKVMGVPTSESTRALAASCGIPLLPDQGPWDIDVNVDGADEVSAALDLVKGGGGAHAREKIVNFASKRNVVIVDSSKLSKRLGEKWPVPVEVMPFAHETTREHLRALVERRERAKGKVVLRTTSGGTPARTDAGNLLYDLTLGPIEDPAALDRDLHAVPGVVETGLFVGRADVVIVADSSGVRRLIRGAR
jgi:ribose 5-phosphate isomerase A